MDDGRIVLVKRGGTSQPSRFDPIWADWSMGSAEREAHAAAAAERGENVLASCGSSRERAAVDRSDHGIAPFREQPPKPT